MPISIKEDKMGLLLFKCESKCNDPLFVYKNQVNGNGRTSSRCNDE